MQYVGNRNRARRLLNNIGGISASLLPFSDTFVRADGDLDNGWDYTAGKWTISGNLALGTPALGADVVINGDFEGGDVNWAKGTGWGISGGVATKDPSAGTTEIAQSVLTVGRWYQANFDLVVNAGAFSPGYFVPNALAYTAGGSKVQTGLCAAATCQISGTNTGDGNVDNIVYRPITTADMFCTRNLGNSNVDITVPLTRSLGHLFGIAMCVDSYVNPQNFILAVISGAGNRVWLMKCVAGTYTMVINNSLITYGDTKELRLVKSGSDVSMFYDGIQEGTTQTISDAGIVNNTRHGIFSTYSGNLFGSFTANP